MTQTSRSPVLVTAVFIAACGGSSGASDDTTSSSDTGVDAASSTGAAATTDVGATDAGDTSAGSSESGTTGSGTTGDDGSAVCGQPWEALEMKTNGQTHAAFDVAVASDGTFVAVGQIENATNDAWVGLFAADGQKLWEHVVDSGHGSDAATGVALDQAGDVVLIGRLSTPTHSQVWVEKRSRTTGEVVWTATLPSAFDGDNAPGDIAIAPDGAIVISAQIRAGDSDTDIVTRKLATADGAEIWSTSFSGITDENGFSIDSAGPIAVAADGSIFVGGTEAVDFDTKEAVLLKYGASGGAEQWKLAPQMSDSAHNHGVVAATAGPDGEVYFVIRQNSSASSAFWLLRASAAGEVEWERTEQNFVYAPTDRWVVAGLAIADDGTLTVGGRLTNEEVGHSISWSEVWIARLSRDGQGRCFVARTWQNTHIIPANTIAYGLAEGPNGTVMVGEIVDGPENYLWVGGFE